MIVDGDITPITQTTKPTPNPMQKDTSNSTKDTTTQADDMVVTPWAVTGKLDDSKYNRLVQQFGVQRIDEALLERFQKVTGVEKLHRLLRRGLFFAHRDLEKVLDDYEAGKQVYIYTGRGPSSEALHLGHIVPIEFTAWLQKAFKAIVVFQMSDDEKYWFKDLSFDEVYRLGFQNARDIIALGFDPDRTFIFSSRDYTVDRSYQRVTFDIAKRVKLNTIQAIFGLTDGPNVGQILWPVYQTSPAFSEAFEKIFQEKARCLVAYAIDQDPYFRLARDVAPKLGYYKPSSIMSRFLPALEGESKMSSTNTGTGPSRTIFLTDTQKEITKKINKYAFSGGQDSVEMHRKVGADLDIDICYQWLRHFMEDDVELERIGEEYASGKMLSGEIKKITADVVHQLVEQHKHQKSLVNDEVVARFYDITKFE